MRTVMTIVQFYFKYLNTPIVVYFTFRNIWWLIKGMFKTGFYMYDMVEENRHKRRVKTTNETIDNILINDVDFVEWLHVGNHTEKELIDICRRLKNENKEMFDSNYDMFVGNLTIKRLMENGKKLRDDMDNGVMRRLV